MKIAPTLLLTFSLGWLASAQDAGLPEALKKLDRDGTGKITREEMPKLFDAIDTDKDGVASPEEFRDYTAKNPPGASVETAPAQGSAGRALPADVEKRTVMIWSDGTKMAADLYLPKNRQAGDKLPGVVFCSGMGGTKKGSPAQLGPLFAQAGYAFLGFDYRGWGESEAQVFVTSTIAPADEQGEVTVKGKAIRWQMNFADQTADIRSAIAWLAGEPAIDPERIGIMGSSYGGGLATWIAAHDPRVKCGAVQVAAMGGLRSEAAQKRAFDLLSKQARGETEPIPFETGKPGGRVAAYQNMRVNPAKSIGFDVIDSAAKIRVPMIIIDAENEELFDIRENGRKVADILKTNGAPVAYHVLPGISHYGIYRAAFPHATKLEIAWFDQHLKGVASAEKTEVLGSSDVPATGSVAPPPSASPRRPEEIFQHLDLDADGKLSELEFARLKDAIPYYRQNPEAIGQTFQKLDTAGAGALSTEQFRRFYDYLLRSAQGAASKTPAAKAPPAAPANPGRPPEEVFAYLDTDADGKLTLSEFEGLTDAIPYFKEHPEAVAPVFQRFDVDGDKVLSVDELRAFLTRRAPNAPATKPEPKPESVKPTGATNQPPTAEGIAFFEKNIRPVLVDHCYKCHSTDADKIKGGLALDSRDGLRAGGDSGPAVVPGDLARSPLIEAIRYANKDTQMPPQKEGGKLPDQVIANFEKWVQMGAPDPREGHGRIAKPSIDIEKGRAHWAFQPVRKTAPPTVRDTAWPRSEIDRFILAGLEAKKMKPVADADAHALIRRVSFDLIGLPPTPEEVEAFVADKSPDAFAKLVDRLLAAPQFGERWGRHWLDVARYADSTGRGSNLLYPQAWRYRDYVIAAFNADKPYDQFLREQIAGDLLPAKDDAQRAAQMVATGFLALGPKQLSERDRLQFQLDLVDEQVDTLSQAMLGMTVGCARCHDHKFDPIPQRDYYALAGIFRSTETLYGTAPVITNAHPTALVELPGAAPTLPPRTSPGQLRTEQARLDKELRALTGGYGLERLTLPDDAEKTRQSIRVRSALVLVTQQLKELGGDGKPRALAMGARDKVAPADMPLYQRGEPSKPADPVPRGFLQVVAGKSGAITAGSGRRELADWIASPENSLTSRVMVNRIWHHLFGRGLVPSVDNFGTMGEAPANPALLDHLAIRFVERGWSVKQLIREVVLSHTYQLGTDYESFNHQNDPENALVWRMSPRRLDAEAARDAMLAVSGRLDAKPPLGSTPGRIGDSFASLAATRASAEAASGMRSVYLTVLRDEVNDSLALFDFANPNAVSGNRDETTTPAQSLYLMNSPVMQSLAEAWAKRLIATNGDGAARVRAAYVQAFGREPTVAENRATQEFFARFLSDASGNDSKRRELFMAALNAFCQALFASAEFRTLN